MTMDEFTAALKAVDTLVARARGTMDPNDIATAVIALAVNGLVLLPVDWNSTEIPQPICYTVNFPTTNTTNPATELHYLIPADQVAV